MTLPKKMQIICIMLKWFNFLFNGHNIRNSIQQGNALPHNAFKIKLIAAAPDPDLKGALSGLFAAENPLKWWKMLFISPQKLFLFSRYLNISLDFLVV